MIWRRINLSEPSYETYEFEWDADFKAQLIFRNDQWHLKCKYLNINTHLKRADGVSFERASKIAIFEIDARLANKAKRFQELSNSVADSVADLVVTELDVHDKAMAKISNWTLEEGRQSLIDAGIITPEGILTKQYGGNG